jgi:hypothetical protein
VNDDESQPHQPPISLHPFPKHLDLTKIPFSREKNITFFFLSFSLSPNALNCSLLFLPCLFPGINRIPAGKLQFSGEPNSPTMVSPENTNWLYDYGVIDDIPVPEGNFSAPNAVGFSWSVQGVNGSSNVRY